MYLSIRKDKQLFSRSMTPFVILSAVVFLTDACNKGPEPPQVSVPAITTINVSGITSSAASSGGTITSDGGTAITARGVCWGTNSNPTITNNRTTDGTGVGSYTSTLTGLTPNTTYYVRAYAMNNVGTGYGNTVSFSTATYTYTIPLETTDGWKTSSLNSVGMNVQTMTSLAQKIQNGNYREVHSILIIKNGKLVFEEYWPGHEYDYAGANFHGARITFDRNRRHNTHSVTKSITSAIVGLTVTQGIIRSVHDSIFQFLPNYQDLRNGGRENITIRHLLTMSSGLRWNEQDVSPASNTWDLLQFVISPDPLRYLLSKQVVAVPGTRFYYNSAGVDLLGVIVASAAGESIPAFSHRLFFAPLGITNYAWQAILPSGITACHGDIYMTPRDMAKFGFLYLNYGVWNGQRIIPSEWIRQSEESQVTTGEVLGYGYLWWLHTYQRNGLSLRAFSALGWGGQRITIVRDLNLVVVFTGANYTTAEPCDEMMQSYILPSITY
jgi:CubicO group peptidase (beta-lactamase class C family)